MMVERYPTLKNEVDGSIPDCETSYLLDIELASWPTASCALMLACRPSVSKKEKRKKFQEFEKIIKGIPKDVNVIPVGLGNAMFSNRLCPKNLPRH